MAPLSFYETKGFELERALNTGLLPPHFLSRHHLRDLRAYVSDYLKEEIASEAGRRGIASFSEFLKAAALTNAELSGLPRRWPSAPRAHFQRRFLNVLCGKAMPGQKLIGCVSAPAKLPPKP